MSITIDFFTVRYYNIFGKLDFKVTLTQCGTDRKKGQQQ